MKKFIFIGVVTILLSITAYFAFIFYVPFSDGVRSGELIKISRKGILSKTWEGEISQGISGAQIFTFSVLDKEKEVINKLQEYQGRYVKVHYIERYNTFFWWGDTHYFINDVKEENSPHIRN